MSAACWLHPQRDGDLLFLHVYFIAPVTYQDSPWAPFSWVTTGSHASRTVARRLLWCVPDHKMPWINPLASALCREMPGTPAMAFIAPLLWGSYNKTCIALPAAFLRKTASRCWEGISFSSASMGQRSETCPGCAGVPCLPCCLQVPTEEHHSPCPRTCCSSAMSVLIQSSLSMLWTELGLQIPALQSLVIPFLTGVAALQAQK